MFLKLKRWLSFCNLDITVKLQESMTRFNTTGFKTVEELHGKTRLIQGAHFSIATYCIQEGLMPDIVDGQTHK